MKELGSQQADYLGTFLSENIVQFGEHIQGFGDHDLDGAMKEAVGLLNREGIDIQMLHFSEVYPFPSNLSSERIKQGARIIAVENNYTGQFADLFSFETGLPIFHKVRKYDGRPFSPQEIVEEVKARL